MASRILSLVLVTAAILFAQAKSQWVYFGADHLLHYRADGQGNRIMDFSYAGYRGGGVPLPSPPAIRHISPDEGDATPRIQAAIDSVSKRLPDKAGLRGAVLLDPGSYDLAGTLNINASGVVLRGSGSGDGGTVINLIGQPHRFLEIRGFGKPAAAASSAWITDSYVPAGADTIHVDQPGDFHPGDTVLIEHPVTADWIHYMGMDTLVRDSKEQTWIKAGSVIRTDRVIKAVSNNRITLDVPLSDSLDAKMVTPPGATLVKYTFPGRIADSGVEALRVVAPFDDVPISGRQFTVLQLEAVIDAWARDIAVQETQNGVVIGSTAKRITFENVRIVHSKPHSGSAAPADFSITGTQVFLNRCSVLGEGTWPVVTQAEVTGPNVVLDFSADHGGVAPHQRWATGLLVDHSEFLGTTAKKQGIAFSNRGTAGSGHGWDIGWAVAWNVKSPYFLVLQPPGSKNWCIGCIGESVPAAGLTNGIFDCPNTTVEPASLYLEQLRERLGDQALAAIGRP
jgi:hypothetical protein